MSKRYHYRQNKPTEEVRNFLDQPCITSSIFSGKLYPSGRVTVGKKPPQKLLTKDKEYESNRSHYTFGERRHWHYQEGLVIDSVVHETRAETLGLASVPNCHNLSKRGRYGLKGISGNGRKLVREGAALLERRYGRRLGFYTLTCPYTDVESIYLYNQNIAYIQRSFFQELKREYQRHKVPFSYVSVLEIQPERYSETGIPVLHIHYISPCYRPGTWDWVLTADAIRSLWSRVLRNTIGHEVSVGASIDASVVRSSAVGYISKYMSKGSQEVEWLACTCPNQLPSQWWSMTSNLRKAIKAYTIHLPEHECAFFMFLAVECPEDREYLRYCRPINICVHGQAVTLGMSGNLQPSIAEMYWSNGWFNHLCEFI